jgi:hypothetical protein
MQHLFAIKEIKLFSVGINLKIVETPRRGVLEVFRKIISGDI